MSGKLEIIPMRITRFETLDGCTALMLNKKNGNLETVRLCILIKSKPFNNNLISNLISFHPLGAEQYTKSLHKKWKTILRIGTELEFELLLDLEFELIVYLHSPTEKEVSKRGSKEFVNHYGVRNRSDYDLDFSVSGDVRLHVRK